MEERLRATLRDEGLEPSPWGNGPGLVYGAHAHAYDKVLVVVAGSIVFTLDGGAGAAGGRRQVELRAGDRLDLPAGTRHAALVGPDGVRCLEAHLPAGALGPRPERPGPGVAGAAETGDRARA